MAGRGRGRGRGAMIYGTAKAPGGTAPTTDPVDKVATLLGSLAFDSSPEEIQTVADTVKKACPSEEVMDRISKQLLSQCQENWRFSSTAAQVINELSRPEYELTDDDKKNLRAALLLLVQRDFKEKDKIRLESPAKFLGCVSLMCQIYSKLRVDGSPFKILTNPTMESLETLLDSKATDEEMICAAVQLNAVGPLLQVHGDAIHLNKLKNILRDKIVDDCGSRDVRLQIIEVLEGFASEWTPDTITPSPVNSVPVPTVSTVTVASDTRVAPSTAATPQSHYLPTTITAPPSAGSGDSLPSYYPPTTCLPPSHGSDSTRPSHYPLTTTISPAPSTQS